MIKPILLATTVLISPLFADSHLKVAWELSEGIPRMLENKVTAYQLP